MSDPLDDSRFRTLRVERQGSVLRVAIDRPGSELNTVNATLHAELTELFSALRSEKEARAVLGQRPRLQRRR